MQRNLILFLALAALVPACKKGDSTSNDKPKRERQAS